MKNYIIAFLIVCLMVSLSFHYKAHKLEKDSVVIREFPVQLLKKDPKIETPVNLLLFFSKENCKECMETFEFLNRLQAPYIVTGIVPDVELKDEMGLRNQTGATFELKGMSQYKRYTPMYGPSLMGVSSKGRILFIIPGISGQQKCLEDFLDKFYGKAFRILMI